MSNSSSAARIAADIRSDLGGLRAGARLPSTRALTVRFGASPVTVQQAIRMLVRDGLVESRPGAGNFVRHERPAPRSDFGWQTGALGALPPHGAFVGSTMQTPADDVIALHSGYPADDLLPARAVQSALARAARSRSALDRPPAAGLPELRAWFAREVAETAPAGGAAPPASDVVVMPGGQSALSSVFRALARPGDHIIMESPGYWGAIAAARQAGLVVVPVPRDGGAVDPIVLTEAFERTRARLLYAMPHFANPTGGSWSAGQAAAVLDVVRENAAFLVEDDWAHDFALDAPVRPLVAQDADGHVVYVRSLTKAISPAIRIAAVIARGPALSRIRTDRVVDGLYVSGVLQTAALEVVTSPGWQPHLRRMREQLRLRRDGFIALVDELLPAGTLTAVPSGGLNLWLRLPPGVDTTAFVAACARDGVLISPGDEWFPAEPTGAFVRVNYSAAPPARFEQAVRVLAANMA
ncbi:aminotransferase-like domain-containing protein [Herbiconiux daphne]|uniref:PLP-dependent aminotransferase family protein n=1 Tax=Herbiconiux daphne TaxID=2970914 RepID=A0ABT2H3R2_9MICO|nr:PLP-dependent aminotransferase family protein [Herbiconiux daphne]MCS5734573.1 PLP-dependent aminotransferase family protein [Herbiconiux daphne]